VLAAARALITRPEPEAGQWVQTLAARGIAAVALPLIAIAPARDPSALALAQSRLADYAAVMLVSGNAARYFFESNQALALMQQAQAAIKTRVWSPGPGTAHVLQTLGIPPERIDQPAQDALQFDSESLWARVGPGIQPGDRVLVVRGTEIGKSGNGGASESNKDGASASGSGRDWLSAQIRAAGGEVDFAVAYTRAAPQYTQGELALAKSAAAADGPLWVLSSAQALNHLLAALPDQPWAGARALATHPRIAQAARAAGFGGVVECRPALADVAASIESLT
jgi:uroporphyrinogen-III synthase